MRLLLPAMTPIRRMCAGALLAAAIVFAAGGPAGAAPLAHRALVISIDGLRPDVMLRAHAPAIRSLMERGTFTMWARTTDMAVTLPSHTSMLTGVPPAKHGVVWNSEQPADHVTYPKSPTLFEVAHAGGLTTAMVAGKAKFWGLDKPGTIDHAWAPRDPDVRDAATSDSAVADTVVRWIERWRPQVMFVHLPEVDFAGHHQGWGSAAQIAAVENADACVERVLEALARAGLTDSTIVLLSADHGGTAKSHGPDDPHSRYIPWIVAGPGIRANLDLTSIKTPEVRTEDTFATVCDLLGLTPTAPVDGHPVAAIRRESPAEAHAAVR